MALNAEQLATYERDGVVFPIDVMSSGEALALRREIEAIETTHGDRLAVAARSDDKRTPTCEGNNDLMAKQGSTRDRPNPRHYPSIKIVPLTGRRSSGFHQGQRSAYRSKKAGYMTASSTTVSDQFFPCITAGVHT